MGSEAPPRLSLGIGTVSRFCCAGSGIRSRDLTEAPLPPVGRHAVGAQSTSSEGEGLCAQSLEFPGHRPALGFGPLHQPTCRAGAGHARTPLLWACFLVCNMGTITTPSPEACQETRRTRASEIGADFWDSDRKPVTNPLWPPSLRGAAPAMSAPGRGSWSPEPASITACLFNV